MMWKESRMNQLIMHALERTIVGHLCRYYELGEGLIIQARACPIYFSEFRLSFSCVP